MLSRLLKPPSKDSKRKGIKDDLKDASLRREELPTPRTPRTPRLERSRNQRWHLVDFDKFEDVSRRSFSSYSIASLDTSHPEPLSPTLSEPICPSGVNKKGDKRIDKKCVQQALPLLESSPENRSLLDVDRSSQFRQQRTSDECDDGDGLSSEYSAGSSAGSPPKSAEIAGVGWDADEASSFTRRARKKVNTPKRLQSNGLDKIKICPPSQEITKVVGPGSPLPIPTYPKSPVKKDSTSPLISPRTSDVARPIPLGNKGVQHNFSGPFWVQERDLSPHHGPRNPLVSPHTPDLARPISNGSKGFHNNLSGPLRVQQKRDQSPHFKSPLQSPGRSPLSSPKKTSRGPLSPHYDGQIAHPLPLPWAANTSSASPRSNTSSADRSEESCRIDSPLVSTKWPRSPGRGDAAPSGGKWLKGLLLGSGSFGKVYRGHHSETGDMCAIKEVEIVADDPRSKECAKQLAQEIALLSMLRHPNILHYKGSEMVGESLYIYLELVSGGSIYRLLQEFNSFAEPVIRRYTRQILLGLQFLHEKNTVHRDIKCANILVDQDGRVKLADFGMAKLIGNEPAPLSFKGSPYWMAPEVILQNNTGFECALDIWSLGCTVIEMASGKPPWFQYEGYAAMFKVMNCHEVPIPSSLSPIGRNFVSLCLQRDPAKRPSATALLEHPFVQVDKGPSLLVQTVSDTLCRDMLRKGMPEDSTFRFGTPPRVATRDPANQFFSGALSPRPPHRAHIPTSRSALQLSDCARPRPAREVKRLGQLTDTEDYTNQYAGSPMNHCLANRRRCHDIHGLHATGLDASTPWPNTPRN